MVSASMPAELVDLVARAARHPHGLGFLHQGYLECVAVTLGVHPFVVDAARAWLATPEGRAELIAAVRDAQHAVPPCAPAQAAPDGSSAEVEALLQAARSRPRGDGLLAVGPALDVAAEFGVHPYLVFRARDEMARREAGGAPEA